MFGQIREDEVQTSPADKPCSNELVSYSSTRPEIGIKGNFITLALNCTHAAATVMNKLSIPQPEALHQRMNKLFETSPPGRPDDPTPLCTETHEYSVPSPDFMYQFRGSSDLYVGLEDKVRPDQIHIDRWEQQVRPRLCTDIKEFEKKMRSSRTFRSRGGLSISPELRMSGRVEASNKVKLSPCIWILYGHERWRKSVQKFVNELEWLFLEGFGEAEVHFGGPRLSALMSSSGVLGLDFDADHMYHLDGNTTLYLHVEEPQGVSACGLICCATIMRDGNITSQRLSRIGGILRVNGKGFGVTTAHGMLEWFVNDDVDSQAGDISSDDESLDGSLSSDEEDEGAISERYRKEGTRTGPRLHQPDTATSINRVHRWTQVSALGLTSFLQTRYFLSSEMGVMIQQELLPNPQVHGLSDEAALGSDFSLWGVQHTETLQNAYTTENSHNITINALGHNVPEGPVQLLLGNDDLRQGFLLPGTMSFFIHGTQFKTRKIRITQPLGQGCSGTWVVRDRQLQGVIVASYDHEPYVQMVTTEDLLFNIKSASSHTTQIQLPRHEPVPNNIDLPSRPLKAELKPKTHTPALKSLTTSEGEWKGNWRGELELLKRLKRELLKWPVANGYHTTLSKGSPDFTVHNDATNNVTTSSGSKVRDCGISSLELERWPPVIHDAMSGGYLNNVKLRDLNAQTLIERFMMTFGTQSRRREQAWFLSTLMPTDTPRHFDETNWKVPERIVGQIFDLHGRGRRVSSHGGLTTGQLYLELRDEQSEPFTGIDGNASTSTIEQGTILADRRLTFIRNLDSYSMAALMLTARKGQSDGLGEALYLHMAFKPLIIISTMADTSHTFELSVHLPLYSWRNTSKPPRDFRLKADGSPVRAVMRLGDEEEHLDRPRCRQGDYLCEAHISLLLKVKSDKTWIGYCFQDTYHHPTHFDDAALLGGWENKLNLNDLHDVHPLQQDIMECLQIELERKLEAFESEWETTVSSIAQRFGEYTGKIDTDGDVGETSRWLTSTRHIVQKLANSLQETMNCWDRYPHKNRCETPAEKRIRLRINRTVSRLRISHTRLIKLDLECDIYIQRFISTMQTRSAERTQAATDLLLHVISPITVAAAVLSMQEKAMPSRFGLDVLLFTIPAALVTFIIFRFSQDGFQALRKQYIIRKQGLSRILYG